MDASDLDREVEAAPSRPVSDIAPGALRDLVLGSLEDDQAQEVVCLDLTGKTSFCDYMVIASGRSTRHVGSMAQHLVELLKPLQARTPPVEGLRHGDWVLIDGGDVVVHLFRPEVRAFYNLEKMWTGVAEAGADTLGG